MAENQPKKIGRYEVTGELGRGGMGIVWAARDPSLDRAVAIKLIRLETDSQTRASDVEQRFLREARVAARLHHPAIATIFDAGREGDMLFLVMELVAGESLARRLTEGRFPNVPEALEIAAQVADALGAAHDAGIVHRDIKPGNILLAPYGRVKVSDFGVAKAVGESTELTRTGTVIGSPAYMAPEQIQGSPVDGRADLFSLGVVLYELLLRRRPFPADTMTTLIYQVLHQDPFQDGAAMQALGPELSGFLRAALAKQPSSRIPDARAFAKRVRELAAKRGGDGAIAGTAPTVILAATPPPAAVPAVVYGVPEPAPIASAVTPLGSGSMAPPRQRIGLAVGLAAVGLAALLAILFLARRPGPPPSLAEGSAVAPASVAVDGRATKDARDAADAADAANAARNARVARQPAVQPRAEPAPAAIVIAEPAPATVVPAPTVGVVTRRSPPPSQPAPVTITFSEPEEEARVVKPAPTPATAAPPPVQTPRVRTPAPVEPPAAPPVSPQAEPAPAAVPVATFVCSQGAEFNVSPEDTLIAINGRTIGIADDWDGAGGGKVYSFPRPGTYDVRLSLAGYQTAHVRIVVRADAEDEIADVDTELEEVEEE